MRNQKNWWCARNLTTRNKVRQWPYPAVHFGTNDCKRVGSKARCQSVAEHVAAKPGYNLLFRYHCHEYQEPGKNAKRVAVPRLNDWLTFVTIPSCPRVIHKAYPGIESGVGGQLDRVRMLLLGKLPLRGGDR